MNCLPRRRGQADAGLAGIEGRLLTALVVAGIQLVTSAPASPAQHEDLSEARQLLDANRLLEKELTVASTPQVYLLVDLTSPAVLVKARGIELYRLPIQSWRFSGPGAWPDLSRVRQRPPVVRTEASVGTDATADPVELAEMPAEFLLACDPPLQVSISPPLRQHPWYWMRHQVRVWWEIGFGRGRRGATAPSPPHPWLSLTLLTEDARSLAWAVTDGMPLLIGRPLKEAVPKQ